MTDIADELAALLADLEPDVLEGGTVSVSVAYREAIEVEWDGPRAFITWRQWDITNGLNAEVELAALDAPDAAALAAKVRDEVAKDAAEREAAERDMFEAERRELLHKR